MPSDELHSGFSGQVAMIERLNVGFRFSIEGRKPKPYGRGDMKWIESCKRVEVLYR